MLHILQSAGHHRGLFLIPSSHAFRCLPTIFPVDIRYIFIVSPISFNPAASRFWTPSLCNPLNADLNPLCHLLALLGSHHIHHISRIRVNIQLPRLSQSQYTHFTSPLPPTFLYSSKKFPPSFGSFGLGWWSCTTCWEVTLSHPRKGQRCFSLQDWHKCTTFHPTCLICCPLH